VLRRLIFPIVLGLGGIAILLSLGVWQVQRMHWKAAILSDIAARMEGQAASVPATANPADDKYRPVFAKGRFTGESLQVISGMKDIGAGVQIIAVLETDDGRRLLVDRGFLPDQDKNRPLATTSVSVTGNLHWPEEVTSSTPPPVPRRACGSPAMCPPWRSCCARKPC
jgi:surfeit locus 1 family protein